MSEKKALERAGELIHEADIYARGFKKGQEIGRHDTFREVLGWMDELTPETVYGIGSFEFWMITWNTLNDKLKQAIGEKGGGGE